MSVCCFPAPTPTIVLFCFVVTAFSQQHRVVVIELRQAWLSLAWLGLGNPQLGFRGRRDNLFRCFSRIREPVAEDTSHGWVDKVPSPVVWIRQFLTFAPVVAHCHVVNWGVVFDFPQPSVPKHVLEVVCDCFVVRDVVVHSGNVVPMADSLRVPERKKEKAQQKKERQASADI